MTTINAESVPKPTEESETFDKTEKDYDRMISQQMMYHRVMMEDLMKLSTETGSNSNAAMLQERMNLVSGLGNTVATMSASNDQLLQSAQQLSNQGSQNATSASKLDTEIAKVRANLHNDVSQYAALMHQMQKEGFSNPTMDAALENSVIMSESQKYAFVLFGVCAIYLFYKTVKYL